MRSESRPALAAAVLAAALVAASGTPAHAVTIDSFEDGDFTITAVYGDPQVAAEQSGLTGAAGGVRLVTAVAGGAGPVGSGAASLATTAADDGVLLSTLGYAVNTDFQFVYDGVSNGVNDTNSGSLNLDLSPFTAIQIDSVGVVDGVSAHLSVWTKSGTGFGFTLPFTSGVMLLPLDGFALNLNSVKAIRIRLNDIDATDVLTITNISAVPEPGTALLLAAGLLGLALGRERAGAR